MELINELIKLIYTYYPQKCSYLSIEYKNSIEHRKYNEVVKNKKCRIQLIDNCYSILKSVFCDYYITKWTNTEYPSVHFSVLLHKNQPILDDDDELLLALNCRRLDLEVYISLLGNYFYTYVIETRKCLPNHELEFSYYDEKEFLE